MFFKKTLKLVRPKSRVNFFFIFFLFNISYSQFVQFVWIGVEILIVRTISGSGLVVCIFYYNLCNGRTVFTGRTPYHLVEWILDNYIQLCERLIRILWMKSDRQWNQRISVTRDVWSRMKREISAVPVESKESDKKKLIISLRRWNSLGPSLMEQ